MRPELTSLIERCFTRVVEASECQGHRRNDCKLAVGIFGTLPDSNQMLRIELRRFDVTLRRKRRPVFVPILARLGTVQVRNAIGVDLDLAPFALNHY